MNIPIVTCYSCSSMKHFIALIALLILFFNLAACSRGPSSRDTEKALRSEVEKEMKMAGELFGTTLGDAMSVKIHEVRKIGCVRSKEASGYNCDVEIDMTAPFRGRAKDIATLRLVKASDGWRIVE